MMDRRAALGTVTAMTASLVASRVHAQRLTPAASITVALCPLGPVPDALLAAITATIAQELGAPVVRHAPVSLPPSAYYRPRRRYRAERLLDFLRVRVPDRATRILGVTAVDISTTAHGIADWGVLGLGDLDGTACVVSTYRCLRGARDEAQALRRAVTTCVHEVGHTLGLDHCPDPGCLMTDARGSVRTVDRTSGTLCAVCRARIGRP